MVFAVSFQNTNFLTAVEAHSKWPEVEIIKRTTAGKTIKVLQGIFARNSLLEQVVTDNGPEFSTLMQENGVKHIRCAPYHSASSGVAECFVQSIKTALKTTSSTGISWPSSLANYLLT